MSDTIKIATRRSPLALWQAEWVAARLKELHPGLQVELVKMVTKGDKILDTPLSKVGGKGLFVKELEVGMLNGDADIAVHSMKDVPVDDQFPEGLHLPVICEREDPRDAFISNNYANIDDLPQGARVGSASLRRQCQIKERRPDLEILTLRGNVNTRLAKLDAGEYDAIILAASGLKRLGFDDRIRECIDPSISLPAVGQGALGLECRVDDERVNALIAPLNHTESAIRLRCERGMNNRLEGGCQVPIAGYAELERDIIVMRGLVGRPDGTEVVRGDISGRAEDAEELGRVLAEDLLSRGAGEILKEVYAQS